MNISNEFSASSQDKDPKATLIKNLKRTVSLLLFLYVVMTLLLRLSGYGEAVFSFDFFIKDRFRSNELGLFFYYCLPFLVWLYSVKGYEPESFLRKYAIVEGVNILIGILLKLPMGFFALAFGMPLYGLFMFLGMAVLGGVFLTVIVYVSKNVKKIIQLQAGTLENEECVKEEKSVAHSVIAMCMMAFCYLAPTLGLNLNWIEMLGTSSIRQYDLNAEIQHMAGSPDGKLLALGTQKGVFVWDTDSRQCVWSDDVLSAQRVRFSPSGQYLAIAGRNPDRERSDIAVFEVENFRRLLGFDLIQEDLSKDKTFHDISFREEEKILSVLWNEDWDRRQMSGRERDDLRRKENDEDPKNGGRKRELVCSTYSLAGKGLDSKIIKNLSVWKELREGNVGFLPDGRHILYTTADFESERQLTNRLVLVDVETGDYRELNLPRKYHIRTPTQSLTREWIEWSSDRTGENVYFSAQLAVLNGRSLSPQYAFCKVNLKSGAVAELYRASDESVSWRSSALSPDSKRGALLGYFFQPKKKMSLTLHFIDLQGIDPVTTVTRVIRGSEKSATDILWLAPAKLVVSLGKAFTLVDLKEGK